MTTDITRRLLDGVDAGVLTVAEQAAAAIDGVHHAHARARWTGRTLRITIEGWVDPHLAVRDADHLGQHAVEAVNAAVGEARVITFIPQAMPPP